MAKSALSPGDITSQNLDPAAEIKRMGKPRSGLARPDRRPTGPDDSETKIWPDRSGQSHEAAGTD